MNMTKYKDLIGGLFFLALAAFIYALSYQLHMTKADPLGPQFVPRLVALLMAVLALVSVIRSLVRLKKSASKSTRDQEAGLLDIPPLLMTAGLLVAYSIFFDKLGFIIVSAIYLFIQIYLVSPAEERSKKNLVINAVVAVVAPIALYYLFYYAFRIFLPNGLLG